MKSIPRLLLSMLLFSFTAQAQKHAAEKVVARFFYGLSELNTDKLRETSTGDFLLLEEGEVWTIDTLINKISQRKGTNFKRVNKLSFISTEQKGDVAWTSYHNTAEFEISGQKQTVSWLESAVLVMQDGRWRIKVLHSTRKRQKS